jgi:hypothetical protein
MSSSTSCVGTTYSEQNLWTLYPFFIITATFTENKYVFNDETKFSVNIQKFVQSKRRNCMKRFNEMFVFSGNKLKVFMEKNSRNSFEETVSSLFFLLPLVTSSKIRNPINLGTNCY